MLHALLINAKPFKRQIPSGAIMRLHRPGQEQRALHLQILDPALHDRQLQRDHPRHLDCAAEADFSVPLREVQIANAELGTLDVNGQIYFASSAQVLDVAVAAVLGPAGDRARALLADLFFERARRGAGVHVLRLRGLGDDAFELGRADEVGFAPVPLS